MFAAVTRAGLSSLAALMLACPWGQAVALSTDKEQPIEIEADSAMLDDAAGVTVYKGAVVIVQGSMRMSGDVLTVEYTPERQLRRARMEGKPARFKQRPDRAEVDDEGEALLIEFVAAEDLLVMTNKAKLSQGERRFSAAEILYDTRRSLLKADGGAKPGAAGTGERVRIVLPPAKKKDAP